MGDALTKPEDLLRQAGEALDNGDWAAARQLFSQSLRRGETPDALEGLAQAAFFLDEAEVEFDARERAYARYRDAGAGGRRRYRRRDAGRIIGEQRTVVPPGPVAPPRPQSER
jgi:hypothetical protein